MVQPPWKIVWSFLKTLTVELPYDPRLSLLGIDPKETKSLSQRSASTPMFTEALFTIDKI